MEREKSIDYISMIYTAPIRDAAAAKDVVKPHKQETKEEKGGASGRGKVSRALQSSLKVVTSEDKVQVTVSTNVLASPPPKVWDRRITSRPIHSADKMGELVHFSYKSTD